MANIDDLRTLVQQIKNETNVGANTAERVGTTFEKTVTELETIERNVSNEAAARQAADTALQQADTTEKDARQTADASLQQAISNEKAARETADASLQQAISNEKAARETADASLQQAISNEKAARETADASLQQADTTEKNARQDADAALQQAIDAVRRSFYTAAGAVYNATTGYYELNGLTDITEEQMSEIYAIGRGFNFGKDNDFKFAYQQLRTNLLPITANAASCGVFSVYSANNAVSCRCMFAYTSTFEVVVVGIGKEGAERGFYPLNTVAMFASAANLRTVLGVLKMEYCNSVNQMFTGCSSLRTVKLSALKINISFADSPLLYYSSLKYLVDNAANTEAITVTVHADVYAKLTRTYEGSVMEKIQQEANETGQDATTLAQSWASLSSTAANKNISFAEP